MDTSTFRRYIFEKKKSAEKLVVNCQKIRNNNIFLLTYVSRLFFFAVIVLLFPASTFAQFDYRSDWKRAPTSFKPYVIKFTTPSGMNILRDAPADHLHHHAMMFALGVDGVNFWEQFNPKDFGRQETTSIEESTAETNGRPVKKVESTITWATGVGVPMIFEQRTITGSRIDNANVLEWTSVLTTPPEKERVRLHGAPYNGLGMRFVESMDRDGTFFTAPDAGEPEVRSARERSIPCRWVAYTAKVNDKPVTVAIFDTKDNPLPMHAFTLSGTDKAFAYLSAAVNLRQEPFFLTAEQPLTFRYKVVLWDGVKTAEHVEAMFKKFDDR